MRTKICFLFLLTIFIPTSFLAYFGLLAVRNEKAIVQENLKQRYETMANIVEEEIKFILSRAKEQLLADPQYWEASLIKAASIFKDEVVIYDKQKRPLGNNKKRIFANAFYIKPIERLPYFIAIYERYPIASRILEEKQQSYSFYISIIIFSAIVIMSGGIFTLSALSYEWNQAKLKSEFAAHLSHDLRRPLTSIRMFSEMLKNERVPSEEKKKEYYSIISEESERLTLLANNVLDFAKIEERRQKYNLQPGEIRSVVRETVERFKMYALKEGRVVEINEDGIKDKAKPLPIKMDRSAISQALMNLLTNADKYSSPETKILVNLKENKRKIIIEVVDQGEGISREAQRKVFDKFYRVIRNGVSEVEGSGLGLVLVKAIVEAHKGKIFVRSEEGKGSTFSMCLPI